MNNYHLIWAESSLFSKIIILLNNKMCWIILNCFMWMVTKLYVKSLMNNRNSKGIE